MDIWNQPIGNQNTPSSSSDPFGAAPSPAPGSAFPAPGSNLDPAGIAPQPSEQPAPKFDLKLAPSKIIAALVGGGIGILACGAMYNHFLPLMWTPLLIALFMLVLMLCITVPVIIVTAIRGDREKNRKYMRDTKRNSSFLPAYCIGMVALFLVTMLFEFLYELNFNWKTTPPTSYIFSLDTSGSMDSTDSQHQLSTALGSMVQQMDNGFPFAVYTFDHTVNSIREMAPRQQEDLSNTWELYYDGGTDIRGALERIYADYTEQKNQNRWIGGNAPKVILMSDGDADLRGMDDLLTKYQAENIVVCTVGTGFCNEAGLEYIARMTGGVFIRVNNINDLYTTMQNAAVMSAKRNLLSDHFGSPHPKVCGFLRILFLTLIGLFMILFFYLADGIDSDLTIIMIVKTLTALLAAILAEALLQSALIPSTLARAVFCLLTALVILNGLYRQKIKYSGSDPFSTQSSGGGFTPKITDGPNTLGDNTKKDGQVFRL